MQIKFSIIVPVYNRPDEVEELLESIKKQTFQEAFEVVIVEDGSTMPATDVIEAYKDALDITYYFKPNSGPGDSRNYGMKRAKGNYYLIFDSDCILPPQYLTEVSKALNRKYVDCFGGPDAAHSSFTTIQKAISYAMTAFLTTGGIRGGKNAVQKFQPRSFNMGISKAAFEATEGFGQIHPGEDPDLTIRIWKAGYETILIPEAYVYHKRRISWEKFRIQVNKFGMVRPILNLWHPETAKLTYWFPTLFCIGFIISILFSIFLAFHWFLIGYAVYFTLILLDALRTTKSIKIAFLSLIAVCIQFYGYGVGFLKSTIAIQIFKQKPEERFPKLFFKK
ncbi:cellulose synthase/poly-beta-1,6-N-acetylglucosamine synthase-like glycosyltransferase [Kordia periserrulae]|uniref:Cellulose synthase/poly-beta-1,6-N-acetylglucosamine synthase-like glycosyltransferase n=1 Tax=Kordia periserrulae TaxID=701523 RepID=A0A2T6BUH3_9FLAO|nr:glycosyltransferase [Kordia periserrulae]PTX59725.1 cellulose synthase/poly-beta-1,6-N-acetylglucosamine synthase-like glycosyltransferase [Kordia periserrulae]